MNDHGNDGQMPGSQHATVNAGRLRKRSTSGCRRDTWGGRASPATSAMAGDEASPLRMLMSNGNVLKVGCVQAAFEGAMYVFGGYDGALRGWEPRMASGTRFVVSAHSTPYQRNRSHAVLGG